MSARYLAWKPSILDRAAEHGCLGEDVETGDPTVCGACCVPSPAAERDPLECPPDGGCGGCGNWPEHCVCAPREEPCRCIAAGRGGTHYPSDHTRPIPPAEPDESRVPEEGGGVMSRYTLTDIERRWSDALDTGCPHCGPVDDCDHIEGYHHALSDVRAALPETPAHLTPEVELRLERMVDAANEAEIRWLLGEWLVEIAGVIPPAEGSDRA